MGGESGIKFTSKSDSEILKYDYPTDSENAIAYFLNGDEFDTYVIGGPYYMGNNQLEGAGLDEYEKLREMKIEEAIKLTQETFDINKKLTIELDKYKENLAYIWGTLIKEDSEAKNEENLMAEFLVEYKIKEEGLVLYYESLDSESEIPAIKANIEYCKTVATVQLANIVIEDINYIMSYASVIVDKYENSNNENIKKAIKEFDNEMNELQTSLDLTRKLQINVDAIDIALKQLEAAEYFIGMASISSIETKIPEIKSLIDNLTPNNQITQEDINFYKEYLQFFQNYVDGYKSTIGVLSPPELPDTAYVPTPFFQEAEAGVESYWDSAMNSLKNGAKTVIKGGATIVDKGLTRSGVKDKYQKAKKTLGIGIGSLNAVSKSGFDMYFGRSNGLERKEIGKSIMENFKKFDDSVKKGNAGAEVYKTAGDYLAGIDEAGEALAEGAIEKVIGKGYTSKLAGVIGKSAGNLFTGFGQGIYKVANPDSSEGEIAEGILDIGLSVVGGSKTLAKGSQVLKGAGATTKQLGKNGIEYIGKLSKPGMKDLISNSLKKTISDGLEMNMKKLTSKLTDGFTNAMTAGWKQLGTKIPKTMNTSYKDFVKKTFKNTLGDYVKAVKGVIGSNPLDFIDNVVGNEADNFIKGLVKEAINETINEADEENNENYENYDEEGDGLGDVTLVLYADYPPGAEKGTVDYQGLIKYELFNSLEPIILLDDTFSFGNNISFSVEGAHKASGNASIDGNGTYNDKTSTISGNFVYKWNGIVSSKDKDNEKSIIYKCSFSQEIPDTDTMTLKTKGTITSTTILDSGKPWTTESSGCPNLLFHVEWMNDDE
ncbi:MAG: hypothetical protein V3575_03670 [Candidatus Absconditabacteria bacterium]